MPCRSSSPASASASRPGPDLHHDRVRFTWQLHPAGGGEPVATGTDYCTVAEDGRLRHVTGFLEQAPAAA